MAVQCSQVQYVPVQNLYMYIMYMYSCIQDISVRNFMLFFISDAYSKMGMRSLAPDVLAGFNW